MEDQTEKRLRELAERSWMPQIRKTLWRLRIRLYGPLTIPQGA